MSAAGAAMMAVVEEQPRIEVQWMWEGGQAGDAALELQELFRSEGIEVEIAPRPPAGNGVGILLAIYIVSGLAVGSFVKAFATEAGKDAWKGTKRLVVRLKQWFVDRYGEPPPSADLTLILHHTESQTTVYVSSELPDEAFRKLLELEPKPRTTYVWDEDRGEWSSTQG